MTKLEKETEGSNPEPERVPPQTWNPVFKRNGSPQDQTRKFFENIAPVQVSLVRTDSNPNIEVSYLYNLKGKGYSGQLPIGDPPIYQDMDFLEVTARLDNNNTNADQQASVTAQWPTRKHKKA